MRLERWSDPRRTWIAPVRGNLTGVPVFDRARTQGAHPATKAGLVGAGGANVETLIHRNDNDRRPAKEIVTARYFRDPPPDRAGRAPDCEDSRLEAELEEVRQALGLGPTVSERALRAVAAEMKGKLADRERLAPRRYRPAGSAS